MDFGELLTSAEQLTAEIDGGRTDTVNTGAADKKAAHLPPSPATDEEDISTTEDNGLQPGISSAPSAGEDEERIKQRIQELKAKVRKYHWKP